jgi:hypothetical protein
LRRAPAGGINQKACPYRDASGGAIDRDNPAGRYRKRLSSARGTHELGPGLDSGIKQKAIETAPIDQPCLPMTHLLAVAGPQQARLSRPQQAGSLDRGKHPQSVEQRGDRRRKRFQSWRSHSALPLDEADAIAKAGEAECDSGARRAGANDARINGRPAQLALRCAGNRSGRRSITLTYAVKQ